MAVIVNAAAKDGQVKPVAIVATFVTTFVSGVIFMVIKMAMLGVVGELAAAMLPVVAMTAVFNAILVGAPYLPIQKALGLITCSALRATSSWRSFVARVPYASLLFRANLGPLVKPSPCSIIQN
ncbi:MAG: hypothetical protein ACLTXI_08760 [Collinsella sp.]